MIHDRQSVQISQKQDEHNIYAVMKTMCPPGYQHNLVWFGSLVPALCNRKSCA